MVNLPAKHVVTDTGHTADHNTIVDALTALTLGVGGPTSVTRARIRLAADNANSMANAAWTAVTMDTADVDSDGLWVQATKSRLLIQQAGTYVLEGQLVWNASVTGFRDAAIWKNGVGTGTALGETVVAANPTAGNLTIQSVETGPVQLNAGDYVELGGYQNSGGALLLRQNGNLGSWLGLRRVDAGNVAYATGGSQLLGRTVSNPTASAATTTTATVLTAVRTDGTLDVTFTAPASGSVIVRLSAAAAAQASGTAAGYWGLLNVATGAQIGSMQIVTEYVNAMSATVDIPLTGLTAGQVYTLRWAHCTSSNSVYMDTLYGGGTGGTVVGGYGPAVMEVYDATIGTPNNSFPQSGITQPFVGLTAYNPATIVGYATTSAVFADMDATNMAVTFVAPASGRVLVRLTAVIAQSAASLELSWNLRDASGNIAGTNRPVSYNQSGAQPRMSVPILVTGLNAGQTYTWRWGHALTAGTGTVTTYAGGNEGAAMMEVSDAALAPNMSQQSPNPFLLAKLVWPAGAGPDYTTTAFTYSAVDATNLKVTFIAPASGAVLIKCTFVGNNAGGVNVGVSTTTTGTTNGTSQRVTGVAADQVLSPVFPISGLTPGQQYTYYLVFEAGSSGTATIRNTGFGPITMEVWDGTAGQGSVQTPPGLTTLGRFYGYKTSGTALVSNTWTVIPINTVVDDPLGKWVAANNAWTAPATGTYLITASVNFGASASDRYFVALAINGTRVPGRSEVKVDATNGNELVYTRQVRLNVGDTVALMAISTTAAVTINGAVGDESSTALEIIQLLDTGHAPSAASASQVIGARISKSANQVLAATNTKYALTFDTEDKDAGGFYNPTAPTRLTVPAGAGGTYRVRAQVGAGLAAAAYAQVSILKNGNAQEVATALSSNGTGVTNLTMVATERLIDLNAGDYVEAYALISTGAGLTVQGGDAGALTFFEIERVNSIALTDPTAQLGDMVVRGAGGALARLPVGDTNGKQLTVNNAAPLGVDYEFPALRNAQSVGDGTGDKNTTSTTAFVALAGLASVSVAAIAGDVIDLQFVASAYSPAAGQADFVFAVAGTTKTDIVQRSTAAALNSPQPVTMRRLYTVQAADISGGTVTVAVYWRSPNGNASVANGAVTGGTIVPVLTAVNIG